MVSKECFCRVLENVRNIEGKFEILGNFLGQPICECDFYDYTSSILGAIGQDLKLDRIKICEDLIFDFAYNQNWGEEGSVELVIDGVKRTASTFEELYDLIKELTEDL